MMLIASFFNSWPGMYLAQTFLHSLVAALIVDTALVAWKIENPSVRQRFRLIVIIVPIIAFPLYQFMSDDRGSALFRIDALFDINRWLFLEVWGVVPLGALFLLVLVFTAVLFFVQELSPIVRHTAAAGTDGIEAVRPEPGSAIAQALDRIPGARPDVFLLDDDEFVVFSSTGKQPAVYLSSGLVQALDGEELRAALAHEIGHIRRSRRPFMVLIFLLRVLMFYNPVILMEFRRIVQEEEKICDDLAVALTGNRAALAGALRKFYLTGDDAPTASRGETDRLRDRIEEYSHGLLIEGRISRLEEEAAPEARGSVVFSVVLVTVCAVSFYLV